MLPHLCCCCHALAQSNTTLVPTSDSAAGCGICWTHGWRVATSNYLQNCFAGARPPITGPQSGQAAHVLQFLAVVRSTEGRAPAGRGGLLQSVLFLQLRRLAGDRSAPLVRFSLRPASLARQGRQGQGGQPKVVTRSAGPRLCLVIYLRSLAVATNDLTFGTWPH